MFRALPYKYCRYHRSRHRTNRHLGSVLIMGMSIHSLSQNLWELPAKLQHQAPRAQPFWFPMEKEAPPKWPHASVSLPLVFVESLIATPDPQPETSRSGPLSSFTVFVSFLFLIWYLFNSSLNSPMFFFLLDLFMFYWCVFEAEEEYQNLNYTNWMKIWTKTNTFFSVILWFK